MTKIFYNSVAGGVGALAALPGRMRDMGERSSMAMQSLNPSVIARRERRAFKYNYKLLKRHMHMHMLRWSQMPSAAADGDRDLGSR